MNCSIHLDRAAVAQCECGRGMCPDCVNSSEYKVDNKPICRECNHDLINELLRENRSLKTKTMIKLVINALFLILGLIIFLSGDSPETGVILFAIGGIPTAWKMTSPSSGDRMSNKIDDKIADMEGVGGSFVNSFIRLLFRLLFTVVIGAVAAPILLIVNIVKLIKCTKRIEENEMLLANFSS